MGLDKVRGVLAICIHCGDCFAHGPSSPFKEDVIPPPYVRCPCYERFHFVSYTLRGILDIAEAVYHRGFPITPDVIKRVYSCVTCGLCAEECTLGANTLPVIRAFREEIVERGLGPPEPNRKVDENISEVHNPFGQRAEERGKWAEEFKLPATGPDLLFAGCLNSYWSPESAKATVRVLKAAGIEVAYLGAEEWCCGTHPGWDGQVRLEEKMARHNLEATKAAGAKRAIFACPSCYRTFKEDYPEIMGQLPFDVIHITELIAELIDEGKIKFKGYAQKLTYHDPCHLGRELKIYEPPRKVLTSIPGVELGEMNRHGRWAWCCGGGAGVTAFADPEFSQWTAKQRLLEAKEAADMLVTACPLCFHNFSTTAEKENIGMTIYDFSVLVAEAMGV